MAYVKRIKLGNAAMLDEGLPLVLFRLESVSILPWNDYGWEGLQ